MTGSAATGGDGGRAGKSVLLAEDDDITQAIVQQYLGALSDVNLTIASDGRRALELCMDRRFDLLIIDRKMPQINGDKLIRHLRAAANVNSATPVILFSASSGDELRDLGVSCPADLILSKPVGREEFLLAVRGFLGDGVV